MFVVFELLFAALGVCLQGLDATVEVPKGFEGEAHAQQAKDNAKCSEGQVVGHSLSWHALRHALKLNSHRKVRKAKIRISWPERKRVGKKFGLTV